MSTRATHSFQNIFSPTQACGGRTTMWMHSINQYFPSPFLICHCCELTSVAYPRECNRLSEVGLTVPIRNSTICRRLGFEFHSLLSIRRLVVSSSLPSTIRPSVRSSTILLSLAARLGPSALKLLFYSSNSPFGTPIAPIHKVQSGQPGQRETTTIRSLSCRVENLNSLIRPMWPFGTSAFPSSTQSFLYVRFSAF